MIGAALLACALEARAQPAEPAFERYREEIPGTGIGFDLVPVPGGSFTLGSR